MILNFITLLLSPIFLFITIPLSLGMEPGTNPDKDSIPFKSLKISDDSPRIMISPPKTIDEISTEFPRPMKAINRLSRGKYKKGGEIKRAALESPTQSPRPIPMDTSPVESPRSMDISPLESPKSINTSPVESPRSMDISPIESPRPMDTSSPDESVKINSKNLYNPPRIAHNLTPAAPLKTTYISPATSPKTTPKILYNSTSVVTNTFQEKSVKLRSGLSNSSGSSIKPFTFPCTYKNGNQKELTARLVSENKDYLYFQMTYGNPIAMQYYMNGIVRPKPEIDQRFQWALSQTTPWSVWLIFDENVPELYDKFLGLIKLEPSDRSPKPYEAEISYVINPTHWNKGICTTVVKEILTKCETEWRYKYRIKAEYNQGFAEVTQIFATVDPANIASCKVLTNNRFMLEKKAENYVAVLRLGEADSNQVVNYGSPRNSYVRLLVSQLTLMDNTQDTLGAKIANERSKEDATSPISRSTQQGK